MQFTILSDFGTQLDKKAIAPVLWFSTFVPLKKYHVGPVHSDPDFTRACVLRNFVAPLVILMHSQGWKPKLYSLIFTFLKSVDFGFSSTLTTHPHGHSQTL